MLIRLFRRIRHQLRLDRAAAELDRRRAALVAESGAMLRELTANDYMPTDEAIRAFDQCVCAILDRYTELELAYRAIAEGRLPEPPRARVVQR